jgi:hypothetical protein
MAKQKKTATGGTPRKKLIEDDEAAGKPRKKYLEGAQ